MHNTYNLWANDFDVQMEYDYIDFIRDQSPPPEPDYEGPTPVIRTDRLKPQGFTETIQLYSDHNGPRYITYSNLNGLNRHYYLRPCQKVTPSMKRIKPDRHKFTREF